MQGHGWRQATLPNRQKWFQSDDDDDNDDDDVVVDDDDDVPACRHPVTARQ